MVDKLPLMLDPAKLCSRRVTIEGRIPLSQFKRLNHSLLSDQGEVSLSLHFDVRKDGLPTVSGSVSALVELSCQRCLEPVQLPINQAFVQAFVQSPEAADELDAEALEPVILGDNGAIRTVDLLEDELMLALPLVPRHPLDQCDDKARSYIVDQAKAETQGANRGANNPFAVLKDLKKEKD